MKRLILICLLMFAAPVWAATIYVDSATGDDGDDGSTEALAKATIQAGITAAGDGGEVYVKASGTNAYNNYYLDLNGDTTADIDYFDSTFGTTSTLGTPAYVDPGRGLKEYLESLELGPYADEAAAWAAFVDIMLSQDRTTWNTAYEAEAINAYIRAGFEVTE